VQSFSKPIRFALLLLAFGIAEATCSAQDIAQVPIEGLKLKGALSVQDGHAILGSGSQITAGEKAATLLIPHRGTVKLCATTTLKLTRDTRQNAASGLMMSLERGALEVHLAIGEYSDVVLTPDFHILISPPGVADVGIWLNQQGDTCIENNENAGQAAPYILVSDLFDDGLYRVQPGQRVQFQHGSVREVVDHYREPCGCPPPITSVADSGKKGAVAARPGEKVAKSDNPFPLAESAGLATPATPLIKPPAAGEISASVTAQLRFDAKNPAESAPAPSPGTSAPSATTGETVTAQAPAAGTGTPSRPKRILRSLGRWFQRVFGS
jgi:hypothetical protein